MSRESGVLDIQHETLDPNDFDNAHPSSPFYVPSLPHRFDGMTDEELDQAVFEEGVTAAIRGDGRKDNPFRKHAYPELHAKWNEGWLRETCGDN